jgi:hypothetical protein
LLQSSNCLQWAVRAEQQALAKWGLNYVISEFLPKKLRMRALFCLSSSEGACLFASYGATTGQWRG